MVWTASARHIFIFFRIAIYFVWTEVKPNDLANLNC